MNTSNLEQLRECCKNEKLYFIVYDGSVTPDLPVLVCKSCFENFPVFQQHIKSKQRLAQP